MIYTEYIEKVIELLDKTNVPTVFNMAHALTGISDEIHAMALEKTIRSGYMNSLTPEQIADIIEKAIMEAFVEIFTKNEAKH